MQVSILLLSFCILPFIYLHPPSSILFSVSLSFYPSSLSLSLSLSLSPTSLTPCVRPFLWFMRPTPFALHLPLRRIWCSPYIFRTISPGYRCSRSVMYPIRRYGALSSPSLIVCLPLSVCLRPSICLSSTYSFVYLRPIHLSIFDLLICLSSTYSFVYLRPIHLSIFDLPSVCLRPTHLSIPLLFMSLHASLSMSCCIFLSLSILSVYLCIPLPLPPSPSLSLSLPL